MKYPTLFHLISNEFKKNKVTSVLIGGFAVNHYKVTRQTAAVDFLITKESLEMAVDILKKAGHEIENNEEVFTRLKTINPI